MKIGHSYGIIIFIIFTSSLISGSNSTVNDEICKKEKYVTAEPGTCLDPRAYRLLKALKKVDNNPYNNDFAKRLLDIFEPRVKKVVDTIVSYSEASVPIRIYYPSKKSLTEPTRVILYIHGGGFMYGSIEEYDMAVKKLAKISERIVVSLDYRLAPEFPFPAGLNDAEAVKDWLIKNLKNIGGKGNKIVLIGDSAGANLATVLALKIRDQQKDQVLCQILYYPPTTFVEVEFPSRIYFLRDERREYLLSESFIRESKSSYLPDSISDTFPYASPLEADLHGNIPPILILNAQVDPIRDDGRFYAEKLKLSGQKVRYVEYEGIIHGFFNLYMIFNESKESMILASDFISENEQQ